MTDKEIFVLAVICFSVIVCGTVIGAIAFFRNQKYLERVIDSSVRYQDIQNLNEKYSFNEIDAVKEYTTRLNSKQKFDRYNTKSKLKEVILENRLEYVEDHRLVMENRKLHEEYEREFLNISDPATEEFAINSKVPYKKYLKYEEKIVQESRIKPLLDITYISIKTYTSPKGRNSYVEKDTYTIRDIAKIIKEIDREAEYKQSKKYQRRAMTPKLRYSILQRDFFTCVICGRKASDGIELEVDHIVPVAKGGKTVESNLRTLCKECNRGKSDRYVEDSLN